MYHKVTLIGNLGRDPEMRYTPNGQAVTQFTVAVNRNFKDQDGSWQEETEWFRVVVFGQQAERAVRDVAADLLALQAKRATQPGYAFGADTPWQREFEASFLFEETVDQERAIAETKYAGFVGQEFIPVQPDKVKSINESVRICDV